MLELILLWLYMLIINAVIGAGALKLINLCVGRKEKEIQLVPALMAGVVAITVYAGFFSIFYKVGMVAHLLLFAAALLCVWLCKRELIGFCLHYGKTVFSWEGALYLAVILISAFFASRGEQHTDTGIYHAQAIRWYEEYGLVIGQGNLQQHFAYNSSYLGYAAIFSMKWLLGKSLHGTNGFLMAALCVWALRGLKNCGRHEKHLADAGRIAILIYSLVCAERIMSPATDFPSMYLVLYIVTRWAEIAENEAEMRRGLSEDALIDCGLLCVAAVCVTTFKLSAGMLVLLALYPAVIWLREKQWKKIGVFLTAGVIVLAPYLIRNVLISGWLIYPLASIDLFDVDWKVPVALLQHDSDQIKVWGRCLFDVAKIDAPFSEWFPVWWDAKDTYEKMLVEANLLAVVMEALAVFRAIWRREKIRWDLAVLELAVIGGIAGWFVTAPFIRYGLGFLLAFPLMAVGRWIGPVGVKTNAAEDAAAGLNGRNSGVQESSGLGPARIAAGFCGVFLFLFLSNYWGYYGIFETQWIKEHLTDPAYLRQQDYDQVEVEEYQMGDEVIYYPADYGENISYHAFPAAAYLTMIERCELRGETVADGFRAK